MSGTVLRVVQAFCPVKVTGFKLVFPGRLETDEATVSVFKLLGLDLHTVRDRQIQAA